MKRSSPARWFVLVRSGHRLLWERKAGTGGLLGHHPGQTQGQDSECGGSEEEVALGTGGGECAPHSKGAGYPLTRPHPCVKRTVPLELLCVAHS